jgi:type IV pilus assembly protein PilX
MNNTITISHPTKQSGVVLVFSLLLLSVLTILALTGMKSSVMGEKMSGNLRNSELAHQAAESALRDAEAFINNLASLTALTNTNGLLREGSDAAMQELDYFSNATWDPASTANYTVASTIGGTQLARPPKYIIKHMGRQKICNADVPFDFNDAANTNRCYRDVFRVTAHGTGLTADTTKLLQAYFERNIL